MNRTITALTIGGLLAFGAQAFADDPPDPAAPSSPGQTQDQTPAKSHLSAEQKQFMSDCMTKAKASNNGMSHKDMRKACMDQMKANPDSSKKPVTPQY